jgi:hypothetical protein
MIKNIHFFLLGACIVLGSCLIATGDAVTAAQMSGSSSQALLYLNCRAVSEDEIEFEFSQPVTVKSLNLEPALEIASIQDGSTVIIRLAERTEPGILLTADLLAEDKKKNTINVIVSFRSRNNRMPKLVINELCTEYANAAAGKKEEFIELKMKSAGNLGAMRVFILGNTNAAKQTIYEFMPVEVKENEYVVLHLRKWDEFCKDEYSDNLDESRSVNSSSNARDFWIPGNTKLLQKKASIVYVLDQDDKVLDAVMLSETEDALWQKEHFAEAAGFLFSQGAWKSIDGGIGRPQDAIISADTTNTRTICRDETADNSNTALDWYITGTSCATPGSANNVKRYSK